MILRMRLLLVFAFLCCGVLDTDSTSVLRKLKVPDTLRQERSDDIPALQTAFDELVSRVSTLEASLSAANTRISAQENEISSLKTKRCETGRQYLRPHEGPETITGDYHERRHTAHVTFSHPFPSTPWVAVSLAELDIDTNRNVRVNIGSSAVTSSGFDAFALEWADTNMISATLTWIACSL